MEGQICWLKMGKEIWFEGRSYNFITYDIWLTTKKEQQSGKSNLLGGLKSLRHLTEEEYDSICAANNRLSKYANDSNFYRTVLWNHKDLHAAIDRHLIAYASQDSPFKREYPENQDIERRLLNFLTSVTRYLDNTASRLKRDHGKESYLLERFHMLRTSAYDNSPSYRFMYGLRNHIQHRGMVLNFRITGYKALAAGRRERQMPDSRINL